MYLYFANEEQQNTQIKPDEYLHHIVCVTHRIKITGQFLRRLVSRSSIAPQLCHTWFAKV